jgi:hypothetical protein
LLNLFLLLWNYKKTLSLFVEFIPSLFLLKCVIYNFLLPENIFLWVFLCLLNGYLPAWKICFCYIFWYLNFPAPKNWEKYVYFLVYFLFLNAYFEFYWNVFYLKWFKHLFSNFIEMFIFLANSIPSNRIYLLSKNQSINLYSNQGFMNLRNLSNPLNLKSFNLNLNYPNFRFNVSKKSLKSQI